MSSHHVVIAGTGRAGTTALVQLLDACGLETSARQHQYFETARAGLETGLAGANAPYVVKHPYLSEDLPRLIDEGFDPARIDAIILPLRDLDDAVASRIRSFVKGGNPTPGGLWRRKRPTQQRELLATAVHTLVLTAAEHQIPLVLLSFPRFVTDPEYTCRALRPIVPDLEDSVMLKICTDVLRPDYVSEQSRYSRTQLVLLDGRWVVVGLVTRARAVGGRAKLRLKRSARGSSETPAP